MTRVLIDTQALIWLAQDASSLSRRVVSLVDDPDTTRLASVASLWEMAIKLSLGKLTLTSGSLADFVALLELNRIGVLPIETADALGVAGLLTSEHKDPFDPLIAAQCLRHDLMLVSSDQAFDAYGVRRVW